MFFTKSKTKILTNKMESVCKTTPFSQEQIYKTLDAVLSLAISAAVPPEDILNVVRTNTRLLEQNNGLRKQVEMLEDMVSELTKEIGTGLTESEAFNG